MDLMALPNGMCVQVADVGLVWSYCTARSPNASLTEERAETALCWADGMGPVL